MSITASQMAKRSWDNLTGEQRSARARHAVKCYWNSLSKAQRSERNRRAANSLTPQQRKDRAAKARAARKTKP